MSSRSIFSGPAGPTGPSGPVVEDQLPWVVELDPVVGYTSSNADAPARTPDSACFGGGHIDVSRAAGACTVTWHTVLAVGTWDLAVMYVQDTTSGVITVKHDGATIDTFDASGATTRNQVATVEIVVADTEPADLVLEIPATKVMKLQKVQLIRQP